MKERASQFEDYREPTSKFERFVEKSVIPSLIVLLAVMLIIGGFRIVLLSSPDVSKAYTLQARLAAVDARIAALEEELAVAKHRLKMEMVWQYGPLKAQEIWDATNRAKQAAQEAP